MKRTWRWLTVFDGVMPPELLALLGLAILLAAAQVLVTYGPPLLAQNVSALLTP